MRHGGTESRGHEEKYKSRHRHQRAGSGAQRSRGPGVPPSLGLGRASQQSLHIGAGINTSTHSIPQITLSPFQVPGLTPDTAEQREMVVEQINTQIDCKIRRAKARDQRGGTGERPEGFSEEGGGTELWRLMGDIAEAWRGEVAQDEGTARRWLGGMKKLCFSKKVKVQCVWNKGKNM